MFSYFSSSDGGSNDVQEATSTANSVKAEETRTSSTETPSSLDNQSANDGAMEPIVVKGNYEQSSTITADSVVPSPALSASWSEAHALYCTKYGTLKATIQQVLAENLKENDEIPWELPRRSNGGVLREASEVADFLRTKRGTSGVQSATTKTPQKSSASSWLMSPLKVVSAVASMMRDPDDEIDDWIQEGDDAFVDDDDDGKCDGEHSSSLSSNDLGVNTPIVNLQLTEAAVQSLEQEIATFLPDEPRVLGLSEWNAWASSVATKQNAMNNFRLSVHDNNFLLQVLVGLNKARIIVRQHQKPKGIDVVVLSSKPVTGSSNDCIPEDLRIPVSLWDIQRAEEQIEKKLQEWSSQAAVCTKKALEYKSQNQIKLATIQLAKRKVIQQRIDSDSRLQIQLLQTKNAIESAQSNRSTVDIMASSAQLLKQLREETPLEEVDQTMDDLQSELDDLKDFNDRISTLDGNVATVDEEEELLKELELLSLNDNAALLSPDTTSADETHGADDWKQESSTTKKIVSDMNALSDTSLSPSPSPEKKELELA